MHLNNININFVSRLIDEIAVGLGSVADLDDFCPDPNPGRNKFWLTSSGKFFCGNTECSKKYSTRMFLNHKKVRQGFLQIRMQLKKIYPGFTVSCPYEANSAGSHRTRCGAKQTGQMKYREKGSFDKKIYFMLFVNKVNPDPNALFAPLLPPPESRQ
jgi:hypothetical protein